MRTLKHINKNVHIAVQNCRRTLILLRFKIRHWKCYWLPVVFISLSVTLVSIPKQFRISKYALRCRMEGRF